MQLSNRVVQVRITPVGLILNHNDPMECFVIFSDPGYVPDILRLVDTPQWVGTHMNLTLDRPRGEIISIITKLLEDKALEEGEEYAYIPMEAEGSPQASTPKKGEEPAVPRLAEDIKTLQTFEAEATYGSHIQGNGGKTCNS